MKAVVSDRGSCVIFTGDYVQIEEQYSCEIIENGGGNYKNCKSCNLYIFSVVGKWQLFSKLIHKWYSV
jgi:hypothetical protein